MHTYMHTLTGIPHNVYCHTKLSLRCTYRISSFIYVLIVYMGMFASSLHLHFTSPCIRTQFPHVLLPGCHLYGLLSSSL